MTKQSIAKSRLILVCGMLSIGCLPKTAYDLKYDLLDSLKIAYTNKAIHITLSNNVAGALPFNTRYAYTDKEKSDLAFELKEGDVYSVSYRGVPWWAANGNPDVLIERIPEMVEIKNKDRRGFVDYRFIKEFEKAARYEDK